MAFVAGQTVADCLDLNEHFVFEVDAKVLNTQTYYAKLGLVEVDLVVDADYKLEVAEQLAVIDQVKAAGQLAADQLEAAGQLAAINQVKADN